MKHDRDCEVGPGALGQRLDCECATRAFLAQATEQERADYDARNSPTVRPRLDLGEWRQG